MILRVGTVVFAQSLHCSTGNLKPLGKSLAVSTLVSPTGNKVGQGFFLYYW